MISKRIHPDCVEPGLDCVRRASAPDTGCSTASDVGKQTLVPYSADYYFFRSVE